ncbi:MAG TPA: cytochrome ubiquinol oxidase subunit I [Candidatus Limnocylindrales bacterium]|nr:cytochrome ubiquinol oxidase subunit I [Candidatus Limnocylindrales bacterium]
MAPLNGIQSVLALNRPDIQFPVVGNRFLVGAFFLAHIIFGSFSMGAVLISPAFEWLGVLRRDPRLTRFARGIAATNLKVFSFGATLGAFAVLTLIGLYPKLFVSLVTIFFWPLLLAFLSWFLTIPLLLIYVFRWRRMERHPVRHITIGVIGGLSEQLFLVLIVGLDSFLLTPSVGLGPGTFFNPSYAPELAHRFVGNLSWASFFIAAVMAFYAVRRPLPQDRAYFAWGSRVSLVLGFLTLLIQVGLGFLFVESIKRASPGAFAYSLQGPFSWLWIVQGVLLGTLLFGSNWYFLQSRPGNRPVRLSITILVALLALLEMAPAALYPRSVFWLRYIFLGTAILLSLAHWALWRRPRPSLETGIRRGGHLALTLTGAAALLLFLLMGVIRETARGDYTVYGQLKESNSSGLFQAPSKGFYP